MIDKLLRYLSVIITLIVSFPAHCQVHNSDSVVPRISLITCHAGSVMYELCGHTALRVQVNNDDIAVNYGLFEFQSDNFAIKFLKGETDYRVGAYPFDYFMRNYVKQNRRVVEQELNLTPEQAKTLFDLLITNLLPENCVYRYNYVKNNCATKPIDIIEKATGSEIRFNEPSINGASDWTFREEMRHFHSNYAWYQFGIDLALGSGIDYILPTREKMFAPEALESMMHGATITDSTGTAIPIVKKETVLHEGKPVQLPATKWWYSPLFVFSILAVVILLFSVRDIRLNRITRWLDSAMYGLFGIAGLLLAFLVFVSVHEATFPNWNILWLNPLALIPAFGIWLKKFKSILLCYHFANFAVVILAFIALDFFGQAINIAIIPLILCSLMRSANYIYITCLAKTTA